MLHHVFYLHGDALESGCWNLEECKGAFYLMSNKENNKVVFIGKWRGMIVTHSTVLAQPPGDTGFRKAQAMSLGKAGTSSVRSSASPIVLHQCITRSKFILMMTELLIKCDNSLSEFHWFVDRAQERHVHLQLWICVKCEIQHGALSSRRHGGELPIRNQIAGL